MKRILATLFLFLVLILALWFGVSRGDVQRPIDAIKETIENLKKAVGDKPLIKQLILERIDLEEMCKRALGRHWRYLSEVKRKEYLEVCANYVEVFNRKQVFESIEFIESVDIKYLKERIDGEYAEVDIQVIARNDKTSVIFKLHLVNGAWKAYDILIEKISQVSSLRSQFDRIIEKEEFEGLLRRLREKIKELDK